MGLGFRVYLILQLGEYNCRIKLCKSKIELDSLYHGAVKSSFVSTALITLYCSENNLSMQKFLGSISDS